MEIRDFWIKIESNDSLLQEEGMDEWERFLEEHSAYREKSVNSFSPRSKRYYLSVNFHDFRVEALTFDFTLKKKMAEIRLYDFFEDYGKNGHYLFSYHGLTAFSSSVSCFDFPVTWLNDILEKDDRSRCYIHHIQTTAGTMSITANNITIHKVKQYS